MMKKIKFYFLIIQLVLIFMPLQQKIKWLFFILFFFFIVIIIIVEVIIISSKSKNDENKNESSNNISQDESLISL